VASFADSVPVATVSATLSLASTAAALAFPAAFLTAGAGDEPPETRAMIKTTKVRKIAPRPPAASGTNLIAWIGSVWAMVQKRSSFSLMK